MGMARKSSFGKAVTAVFCAALLAGAVIVPPAAAQNGEVTLAWDANTEPDLAGYRLHRGQQSGSYDSSEDVGNVTTYPLTGLDDGATYYFAVTALDGNNNESGYSNEVSTTFAPAAPGAVAAGDGTFPDRVRVTWQDVSGETGYTVHRADTLNGTYTQVGTAVAGATSFDDSLSCGGTVYYYRVGAANSGGSSDLSAAESGFTGDCPPPPVPQNVAAGDGASPDFVTVTWSASAGADDYRVYRSNTAGGAKTALGSWQTALSYQDTAVTPGATYFYWVSARNGDGESDFGGPDTGYAELPAEVVSAPNVPTGPASGYTGVTFAYTASGGSSSYGDAIQYRFDWGDGTRSAWQSAGDASESKSWAAAGSYTVRVQARCVDHPEVESAWSSALSVAITVDTEPPASPTGLQVSSL